MLVTDCLQVPQCFSHHEHQSLCTLSSDLQCLRDTEKTIPEIKLHQLTISRGLICESRGYLFYYLSDYLKASARDRSC